MKKTMNHTAILRGFLTALAALLTLAGCSNPVSPSPASGPVGRVTFTIGGAARAVLPSVDQFAKITLSFAEKDDSPALGDVDFTGKTVTVEIEEIGSWDVSVKAYIGATDQSPAAVSSAAKTISWTGSGTVQVTGGSLFLLEPAVAGQNGKLRYTVTLPGDGFTLGTGSRIRIEQNGEVLESLDDQNFTDGERSITASIEATDLSLPAGLYVVDILVAKDDETVAVYRRSVSIMSGLITAIVFDAAEFLDPDTAAAKVNLEALEFGVTNDDDSISDIDYSSPPALFITGLEDASTVFFTLTKTTGQNVAIGGDDVASVTLATSGQTVNGSTASDTLAVFAVQNVGTTAKTFTITVAEEGRSPSVVNVTVLQEEAGSLKFGLYSKAATAEESAYAKVDIAAESLDDILKHLAQTNNLAQDTSYLIAIDRNQTIDPWFSFAAVNATRTGIEITLRGINMDSKNGGENWKVTPTGTTLLTVRQGTTLVLDNGITLDGNNTATAIVNVTLYNNNTADVSFVMRDGSKIINGNNTVTNNVGSAVNLSKTASDKTAKFIMEGGEISGNTSSAAIVHINDGDFIMRGSAKINNNTITKDMGVNGADSGGALYKYGTVGTVLLESGEISGNNKRGVVITGGSSSGTFFMTGGKIIDNGKELYNSGRGVVGAGLYLQGGGPALIIGGEISGNGAENSVGSAIKLHTAATLSLSGTVSIEGSIDIMKKGSNEYIFLDSTFNNGYTGEGSYAIPLLLEDDGNAWEEADFWDIWLDGISILKHSSGGEITKALSDNFYVQGGVWGGADFYLENVDTTGKASLSEAGILKIREAAPYSSELWFGEETSLSVVNNSLQEINSGDLKDVDADDYFITLKDAAEYSNIAWHINGTKSLVTGGKLSLDTNKKGLTQVTVEAYKEGLVDTGTFKFNIQ